MKKLLSTFILLGAAMFAHAEDKGIVTLPSPYPVNVTINRLAELALAKNMQVFARIDFAADARKAGLTMHDSQLLVFGNPKGGTPVMQATPQAALDLPLKALAWQDEQGKVWISYNAPFYLGARHGIAPELLKPLEGIKALVQQAVTAE
jgi:uncharacterized protein (DUF302 family)